MKLKLLNNKNAIDSEFSDFERDTFKILNFENEYHSKIIINQSKFSSTYKFKSHNKWLCLKQLNKEYSKNTLYNQTIENEFNIGYELNHSNIVQYYNLGKNSDGPYLIKEYIDGVDLNKYFSNISSENIFYPELERIFTQLSDVLNYLHTKQIYHLDLKPSNVLITTKGNNVKLIDFGLSTRDNHTYNPGGTKKYVSPEQITNPINVDGRSDIYSLGKILKELLVLKRKKRTVNQIFSHLKFLKIIQKCSHENQSKRFRSISEFEQNLKSRNDLKLYFTFIFFLILTFSALFLKPTNYLIKKQFITYKNEKNIDNQEIITFKKLKKIRNIKHYEVNSIMNTTSKPTKETKNYELKIDSSLVHYNNSSEVITYPYNELTYSNLTLEDKLFCENLIDSLHTMFTLKLANKPEYIDVNKLILQYKIQLITFGNKQLTKYDYKFCKNKNRVTELKNYYNFLKEKKLGNLITK